MVVLVPSNDLNPEPEFYYQQEERVKGQFESSIPRPKCPERTFEEANKLIAAHKPTTQAALDFEAMLNTTMNVSKILAVEVDHCTESFGCLIISQRERGDQDGFGRIFYSGDTNPC